MHNSSIIFGSKFFFQKRLCIKGLMSDSKIVSSQENAKDKITQYACLLKKDKKRKNKRKLKNTKNINVPAYDCNWSFCFYVSCERNQTEDVAHCLCIVCLEAAHRLSHINGPCFIAFLLKNNIHILFKSHWKKMYIFIQIISFK